MDLSQWIRENSKPLNEVLTNIAAQIHCDPQELISYAAEDQLGGYHWNPAMATFKMGSCYGVEGQILYALIRYLKPEKVVEIGGWAGCSGSHEAAAVIKNGVGHVYSVDNEVGGQPHGADMPEAYRKVTTLIRANGEDWLPTQPDGSIGLLFEDATHSTELVEKLTRLALPKIEAGGILANHDAMHKFAYVGGGQVVGSSVGDAVQTGLRNAGAYFSGHLAQPSDCGLAITVVPGVKKIRIDESASYQDMKKAQQTQLASDHLAALSQVSNSNIESMSEPPPVGTKWAQISTPPQETHAFEKFANSEADSKPVKKTRNRKPKAK